MQAYIRNDSGLTQVECLTKPLWWQDRGLSFTATGYGKRIPTRHLIQFNGRWRRVYCCIFSNIGTLYIGKLSDRNTVDIYETE